VVGAHHLVKGGDVQLGQGAPWGRKTRKVDKAANGTQPAETAQGNQMSCGDLWLFHFSLFPWRQKFVQTNFFLTDGFDIVPSSD